MSQADPVVARVPAARRETVAECGGGIHALFERARKIEAGLPERVQGCASDRGKKAE